MILVNVECKLVSLKLVAKPGIDTEYLSHGTDAEYLSHVAYFLSIQVGGVLTGHEKFFFNGRWRYHV